MSANGPLLTAIDNMLGHCEAVLLANGSASERTSCLWTNPHELSIPYPNAIILNHRHASQDLFNQLNTFLGTRIGDTPTSIVDPYSVHDFGPLGFRVLFSDTWSVRGPGAPVPAEQQQVQIEVREVTSPRKLLKFDAASAAGFETAGAGRSYPDVLLQDRRYRFYVGVSDNDPVTGVMSFNDGNSVGIYTLFTLPAVRRQGYGEQMVRRVLADATGLPACTNPSGMSNGLFRRLGFYEAGKRTIWVRRSVNEATG